MAKYRQNRINDSVVREMAEIIREIKDPRVTDAMVTITAAEVTPDLKYAKIFFSAYSGDPKDIQRGLESAAGFIRMQLAHRLNLRQTPELTFRLDESIAYGANIASLLKTIDLPEDEDDEIDD